MRTEQGKIEGDLTITEALALYGQATGNVVVADGGNLQLYGMVKGNVVNDGGDLQVFGVISGSLHSPSGTTEVNANAVVHNRA